MCDFCQKEKRYMTATTLGVFCEDCLKIWRAILLDGLHDIQQQKSMVRGVKRK